MSAPAGRPAPTAVPYAQQQPPQVPQAAQHGPQAPQRPAQHPTVPQAAKQPREARQGPPFRIALTILQLAAIGPVGSMLVTTLFGSFGLGIGLSLLLGVGLLLLVALVYAVFGVAWFESQRISGLYGIAVPTIVWQPQTEPGFKAWFKALCQQAINGRMWRSVANFVIASLMGMGVLWLAQGFVHGLISMFNTTSSVLQPGIVGMLLCGGAIVGLALLHRIVSVAILGSAVAEEQLETQVRVTSQQREGAVRAADVERTRIERDLHDGVQPRLVSVAMTLGLAQQKIETDPAGAKELVAEAHTSTKAAITELRQLARGIYASVLDDRGLDAALSALAARSHIPVQLDVRLADRYERTAEAAIYFAIAESLTNAAKHSRASECRVMVRERSDGMLWARVEDNGIGNARVVAGGGLDGIMNRVLAAGGTTRLDSPQGGPTTLEVSVPCAF
ncbi:sensor histidine kinase [Leucobacter exalbidus]|nr:histidine kinase [Leucobacter exalbidus]